MELPKNDSADATPVLVAAIAALFQTHPDRDALRRVWEPLASAMSLMAIQAGKTNIASNPNVVIAQRLLDALNGDGSVQSENPTEEE